MTFRRSAKFRAREPLKQPGRIFGCYSVSIIGDRQASNGVITLQLDANRRPRGGVAKRVVEEIGDKLLQQPSIAHRPYRGGYRCDEQVATCLNIGAVGFD